jgi:hypothetical protein
MELKFVVMAEDARSFRQHAECLGDIERIEFELRLLFRDVEDLFFEDEKCLEVKISKKTIIFI